MLNFLKNELLSRGIDTFGVISLKKCRVVREYKLKKCGFDDLSDLSVIMLAIPYYTHHKEKNISSYAIPRDYHAYCKELFGSLIPLLNGKFEGYRFAGFADDSPIDERDAAARSGIGVLGENQLILTEKYSSYIFLAELITDYPLECNGAGDIKKCHGCMACRRACPAGEIGECLSSLTQKKGELTKAESDKIKRYGSAWGCDICQEVCPYTKKAIENGTILTPIEFFKESLIPCPSSGFIDGMSDCDFSLRAYSWRKRETVRRNLLILEDKTSKE